jgi:two-component system response regulator HydG
MAENAVPKSNILVIDDEREHAQVMCEALNRLGHKCDVTYNLAEARGRLERRPYDVVVTDLVMDGKRDGLEVLRLAKEHQPMPPVILVTAHADIPTCKQALNEGAYDYIEKPLDLEYFPGAGEPRGGAGGAAQAEPGADGAGAALRGIRGHHCR